MTKFVNLVSFHKYHINFFQLLPKLHMNHMMIVKQQPAAGWFVYLSYLLFSHFGSFSPPQICLQISFLHWMNLRNNSQVCPFRGWEEKLVGDPNNVTFDCESVSAFKTWLQPFHVRFCNHHLGIFQHLTFSTDFHRNPRMNRPLRLNPCIFCFITLCVGMVANAPTSPWFLSVVHMEPLPLHGCLS